ncbi:MAG TPA: hypothetical protein VM733_16260 [Thermoanaerobaculia bacterium]|nr:hypothetical protein [Thermoanaerobaculia bacterium]
MIEADSIPQHLLNSARAEISKHRNKLASLPGGSSEEGALSLGESFSVWTLQRGFEDGANDPRAFAQIGFWQQIYVAGRASAFARLALADNDLALEMIGIVDVVPAIDTAIQWLDDNVSADCVVRLLIVPFAHAHLFWLHGPENQIVPIDRPLGTLQPLALYSLAEFFAAATEARRHVSADRIG